MSLSRKVRNPLVKNEYEILIIIHASTPHLHIDLMSAYSWNIETRKNKILFFSYQTRLTFTRCLTLSNRLSEMTMKLESMQNYLFLHFMLYYFRHQNRHHHLVLFAMKQKKIISKWESRDRQKSSQYAFPAY